MVEELPVQLGSLPPARLGVDEDEQRVTVRLRRDLEAGGARPDVYTGVGGPDHLVPALLPHHRPLPVEDGGADGGRREDVCPVRPQSAVGRYLAGAPVVELEMS